MGMSPSDFEKPAGMVRDRMESGFDMIEEYGGPLLERYGRTALMVGVALVAVAGVALVVARRRRRRTLTERLTRALPDMGSRLERPISTIKAAADRISR